MKTEVIKEALQMIKDKVPYETVQNATGLSIEKICVYAGHLALNKPIYIDDVTCALFYIDELGQVQYMLVTAEDTVHALKHRLFKLERMLSDISREIGQIIDAL
ncbi:hypothetical protein ACNGTO_03145 [Bisgaard Taxon 45]